MKVPHKNETYAATLHNHWTASLFMVLGFGVLAVAGFWIRKCKRGNWELQLIDFIIQLRGKNTFKYILTNTLLNVMSAS